MMSEDKEVRPRGVCCHEAGHAVMLHSFNVPVIAIRVAFTEEKGWHGGTDCIPGSVDHLHFMDRVLILIAGRAAENVFDCRAHDNAWHDDLWRIPALLTVNGIPEDKHWARITQTRDRARPILESYRAKVLKLIGLLATADVDRSTFERLMNGET